MHGLRSCYTTKRDTYENARKMMHQNYDETVILKIPVKTCLAQGKLYNNKSKEFLCLNAPIAETMSSYLSFLVLNNSFIKEGYRLYRASMK